MKCFALALLATAAFAVLATHTFPVQPAHLSVNGRTLCGSPIGMQVDVLSADGSHQYCPKCQAVIDESNATE